VRIKKTKAKTMTHENLFKRRRKEAILSANRYSKVQRGVKMH